MMIPNESLVLLAQAKAVIEAEDYQTARMILAKLVQGYPDLEEAWLLLAHISTDRDRTITFLEQVVRINPNNRSVVNQLNRLKNGEINEVNLFAGLNKPKIKFSPVAFDDQKINGDILFNMPNVESPVYSPEKHDDLPNIPTSPPIVPVRKPLTTQPEKLIEPTQFQEKPIPPPPVPSPSKDDYWARRAGTVQPTSAQPISVKKKGPSFWTFLVGIAFVILPVYALMNGMVDFSFEGYEIFIIGGLGLILMVFFRKSRWLSGCGWGLFIGTLLTLGYYFIYQNL
jgi:hypothetical protein